MFSALLSRRAAVWAPRLVLLLCLVLFALPLSAQDSLADSAAALADSMAQYSVSESDINFSNQGQTIVGTLAMPEGDGPFRPRSFCMALPARATNCRLSRRKTPCSAAPRAGWVNAASPACGLIFAVPAKAKAPGKTPPSAAKSLTRSRRWIIWRPWKASTAQISASSA